MKTTHTNRLSTTKLSNGVFAVLWDGLKTDWQIVNGCLGVSGRGQNAYLITNSATGTRTRIGSIQKCKKTLALTLASRAQEAAR